ncbi:hypothetical protein DER46DRAFT_581692 [Fusarium sp. MPI-SDFR-AT-0072]|nr:hypothetical protein DER46DRAFT_581692 [Fusarium sp. MPI-SDFR-AT-0072]
MTPWQKLNEYYTKLGDSPLFAASIILHPSLGMNYLEVNWASEEQLVWVRDAKIGLSDYLNRWYRCSRPVDERQKMIMDTSTSLSVLRKTTEASMIDHHSLNHQSLGLSSCSNRSHLLAQRAIQDVTLEAPVLAANRVLENDSGRAGKLVSAHQYSQADHAQQAVLEQVSAGTTESATEMQSKTSLHLTHGYSRPRHTQPHGSQGLHGPLWELRFDHEVYLSNDFPSRGGRPQRVRIPIPGPETDLLPSYFPPQSSQEQSSPARAEFQSALELVQEVIGTDRRLTLELAQSSDALESPPPYSPPREPSSRPPSPEEIRSSPPRISSSPAPDAIPNPPIPGNPFPTVETLLDSVNALAKANGFGFAKHNGRSYKGRKIRYSLRCDVVYIAQ